MKRNNISSLVILIKKDGSLITIYVSIRNPSQSTTSTPSYLTSFDRCRPALSKTKPFKKTTVKPRLSVFRGTIIIFAIEWGSYRRNFLTKK